MYHDRYGPTDEKLAAYLKELFDYEEPGEHLWRPSGGG